MQSFFTSYLDLLQDCHNGILEALEGLSQDGLDWIPGRDMNSIAVLLAHITGSERYWIGDIAVQESSNRNRDAEFRVHGVEVDAFRKRLADNLEYARNVLEKMSIEDLESARLSPNNEREYTVAWALLHALEHATSHLGQIQITRQLWEQSKETA